MRSFLPFAKNNNGGWMLTGAKASFLINFKRVKKMKTVKVKMLRRSEVELMRKNFIMDKVLNSRQSIKKLSP